MSNLRHLIKEIYDISMQDLSANCSYFDHIEYIEYRLCGGTLSEEEWYEQNC